MKNDLETSMKLNFLKQLKEVQVDKGYWLYIKLKNVETGIANYDEFW